MPTTTPPLPSATASTTAASNGMTANTTLTTELLRLRERFTSYEHFDQQLDDMVTGLTDLLHGAAELRRRTNQEITSALARLETLIADDRVHQRHLLTTLHTDLDTAHQRTSALSAAIETVQRQLADITDRLPESTDANQPKTSTHRPLDDPPNGSS